MNEKIKLKEENYEKSLSKIEITKDKMFLKDRIESIVKIIALVFTAVTLFFTYSTYNASQKWKVAEFTALKIKEFSENKSVKIVNKMLDYNTSKISFDDEEAIFIDDDYVDFSLRVDTIDGTFLDNEVKIRDIFDEYFDQLSLFNRYAKADLIKYEEMKPYLIYQVSIIADTNNLKKSKDFRQRMHTYINYYGFNDVNELYKNLGYDIGK